jgi:hypothetical protein
MNKVTEIVFSRIISPIIVLIISPIVLSIVSYVKTGDIKSYFLQINTWVYITFFSIITIWILLALAYQRKLAINQKNHKFVSPIFFIPTGGYVEIGKYRYAGLDWIIRHPRINAYEEVTEKNMWNYVQPNSVDIALNARCPNCGTELEEKHLFFKGVKLSCPREDFKTISKESMYEMTSKIEKLVRRDIELKKQK